ncbi:MAG: hypothetical protein LBK61_02105 [Spirochaetaceae bacterium]|jgi:hypothetical protein|nr:hypothetical protein [Spirochaetaceae bacterium]
MNEKEGLNLLDFLATGIDRDDTCIQAVLSDENGEGAAANETEALVRFINYYTRTDDVENHEGYTLDMIVKMFSKLRRRVTETDGVLLRRFLALTRRKGDAIWGNALNMKHVFEMYFRYTACYVAESTGDTASNILENGDFELDSAWTLGGGAAYAYDARFSGKRGLCFDGGGGESCVQRLERLVLAGTYTLHFFLRGKCGVIIEREDGKYWNANDQEFSGGTVLEWADDEVWNIFEKRNGWDNAFCFIKIPEDIHKLAIKIMSIGSETADVDYVRLFPKPANPSYTLVFQYEGYSITEKSLHTGADGEDPIPGVDYKHESYFDHAFIVGPAGVSQSQAFRDVLDIVRPRGIQAFAEFVEKNTVEQEEASNG